MTGVGIAWASTLSMPYAILAGSLPAEKTGVYMGIFNFFIVIPEIVRLARLRLGDDAPARQQPAGRGGRGRRLPDPAPPLLMQRVRETQRRQVRRTEAVCSMTAVLPLVARAGGVATRVAARARGRARSSRRTGGPGHSLNPVRLLIRGRNLAGARVEARGRDSRRGQLRVSASGTYLFVDVDDPTATPRPGRAGFTSPPPAGAADRAVRGARRRCRARAASRASRPTTSIYLIMPDRFANGDPSQRRSAAVSHGLLDRAQGPLLPRRRPAGHHRPSAVPEGPRRHGALDESRLRQRQSPEREGDVRRPAHHRLSRLRRRRLLRRRRALRRPRHVPRAGGRRARARASR